MHWSVFVEKHLQKDETSSSHASHLEKLQQTNKTSTLQNRRMLKADS